MCVLRGSKAYLHDIESSLGDIERSGMTDKSRRAKLKKLEEEIGRQVEVIEDVFTEDAERERVEEKTNGTKRK